MVSGFVCDCCGFIKDEETGKATYTTFEAGTNRDGWFNNEDLIEQLEAVIPIYEKYHPNCKLVFAFDNSMTHHAKSPDGLDAMLLPLKDDGKNAPKTMRKGWYRSEETGLIVEQCMQTVDGKAKGLRTILTERGKFIDNHGHPLKRICHFCNDPARRNEERVWDGFNNEKCCAVYVLSHEPDFAEQQEWLTETVQLYGHDIIFYPKFHCELNYIEMIWGWLKSYHRRSCSYSYRDLKEGLPKTMEEIIPITFIRRALRHCLRFMSGYRIGLEGPLLDYTTKLYSSHRKIPNSVTSEIAKKNFADHNAVKSEKLKAKRGKY
jgi:hypothetical protein